MNIDHQSVKTKEGKEKLCRYEGMRSYITGKERRREKIL